MKRYSFIILGLIGMAFTSCQTAKKVPKTASIEYQRTACFGTCPIYTMTIDGSGLATFEGKRFTEKIGSFTKQLTKDETKTLFNRLRQEDWNNFQTNYKTRITDLPSTVFRFNYKKISKEVVVTGEHPEVLDVLSKTLSKIAESDGWSGTITE